MEGRLWRDGFPEKKKNLKILQGHQRVMFRFLRSSYEKVEWSRDFWQSVLQFGWEFIQQLEKKVFIKTFCRSGRERKTFYSLGHIIHTLSLTHYFWRNVASVFVSVFNITVMIQSMHQSPLLVRLCSPPLTKTH